MSHRAKRETLRIAECPEKVSLVSANSHRKYGTVLIDAFGLAVHTRDMVARNWIVLDAFRKTQVPFLPVPNLSLACATIDSHCIALNRVRTSQGRVSHRISE
jgi:hypothetical protein